MELAITLRPVIKASDNLGYLEDMLTKNPSSVYNALHK